MVLQAVARFTLPSSTLSSPSAVWINVYYRTPVQLCASSVCSFKSWLVVSAFHGHHRNIFSYSTVLALPHLIPVSYYNFLCLPPKLTRVEKSESLSVAALPVSSAFSEGSASEPKNQQDLNIKLRRRKLACQRKRRGALAC